MNEKTNDVMSLNEFCEYVEAHIKEYLPESYQNWEILISDNYMKAEPKKAFTIKAPNANVSRVIYLDDFYDMYRSMNELPQLMNQISSVQIENDKRMAGGLTFGGNTPSEMTKMVQNWEFARDKVVLDTAGCTKNAEMLAHRPNWKAGDIAAIYKIELGRNENGTFSIPVTNEMKAHYGVTTEELHLQAIKNTEVRHPFQLTDLPGIISQSMCELPFPIMPGFWGDNPGNGKSQMLILSNDELCRGACVVFYPGVLDRISEMFPDGFYIAPSSVHEVLIIPKDKVLTQEKMDGMIEDINGMMLEPEEQLSDFVHEYDPARKMIYAPALGQDYDIRKAEGKDLLQLNAREDIASNSKVPKVLPSGNEPLKVNKTEQQMSTQRKRAAR